MDIDTLILAERFVHIGQGRYDAHNVGLRRIRSRQFPIHWQLQYLMLLGRGDDSVAADERQHTLVGKLQIFIPGPGIYTLVACAFGPSPIPGWFYYPIDASS